ncbi:type II toxin-antitoxin system RelE family toxin [Pelagicoccus mobilis]|uniref:Cytotoxic translational repressor of toxin-antitoxin stability system n=1 Tax=Pelagicoccus mobilis TaxID=415221 RepID=A0A934S3E6_9BACT|nr:cytotoxic translational repressor of toxin-antitoxin stability system [Pelagicoccus mobilis]MBK1880364.1 cytotoxic translational repressor of toxin-antitoxin stability system [Pelagicoccus mobilis]
MFQVTFSEQALHELEKLPTMKQLAVIDPLSNLTEYQLNHPEEPLGSFKRDGKVTYRLRSGEHRIYFHRENGELNTICILHKNTLTDFIFRTKLPISEEQLEEQHSSFWKYLDSLKH